MKKIIYRRCAIFAGIIALSVIYACTVRADCLPSNMNSNHPQYAGDYATCEFYMQSEQGVETVKVFKERVMERYLPDGYR